MRFRRTGFITAALSAAIASGCASMDAAELDQLRAELSTEQQEKTQLAGTVQTLQSQLAADSSAIEMKNDRIEEYEKELQMAKAAGGSLLPPAAKAGECYARVYIPPTFSQTTKTLAHTEDSEIVAATAVRYEWAEKEVLVREASTRLEVVPARYDWVEEQMLVKEAAEKIIVAPAVYKDQKEQVLVSPAYTTWKRGRGPIERIDESTGEIMCLVEVPAKYQTIVRHVIDTPAGTRRVAIPAEYKTVKRRVMVEGPKTVSVEIPAEYKTLRIKRVAEAATESRSPAPGRTQDVVETRLVSEGALEWRSILCETNTTPQVVSRLQQALNSAGYTPGRIDGIVGRETMQAVGRYQSDKGLPSGKLTIETLQKLGVM